MGARGRKGLGARLGFGRTGRAEGLMTETVWMLSGRSKAERWGEGRGAVLHFMFLRFPCGGRIALSAKVGRIKIGD